MLNSLCQAEPWTEAAIAAAFLYRFDDLIEEFGVYKVETIGDCYMVAGGLIFTDAQGFKSVLQSQVKTMMCVGDMHTA